MCRTIIRNFQTPNNPLSTLFSNTGMTHCQVVDGGDDLYIWRVVVNILITWLGTASKMWAPRLGVGLGLTPSHHKKLACYKG
jgi:hypothetical protein